MLFSFPFHIMSMLITKRQIHNNNQTFLVGENHIKFQILFLKDIFFLSFFQAIVENFAMDLFLENIS